MLNQTYQINQPTNNFNITCMMLINGLYSLTSDQRMIIQILHTIIIVTIVIVNTLVIHGLLKTKQLTNLSLRLTFYLSFSDICSSLSTYLMWMLYKEMANMTCIQQKLLRTFYLFSTYLCVMIVFGISIDRYIRVVHQRNYNRIMTKTRQHIMVGIATFISVTMSVGATHFSSSGYTSGLSAKFYVEVFAFIPMAIAVVYSYIKSIKVLKRHMATMESLSSTGEITFLATLYLILMTLFYMPYIITLIHMKYQPTVSREATFSLYLTMLIIHVNAIANGISCLLVNRKIRMFYEKIVASYCIWRKVTTTSEGTNNTSIG